MRLNTLKPAPGAISNSKRVGRGEGSGKGGTSTRGNKGAQSRSGYKRKRGFEGGQLPLQRRIPRYGFKNPGRVPYKAINLTTLQRVSEKVSDGFLSHQVFMDCGIVSKKDRYKILGKGTLSSSCKVQAHAFSASAKEAILQHQGEAILIDY